MIAKKRKQGPPKRDNKNHIQKRKPVFPDRETEIIARPEIPKTIKFSVSETLLHK